MRILSLMVGVTLAVLCPAAAQDEYDVVVYGGTSAGVAAAVQVARMGKSIVLIEPGQRLGGMTSGGLGATDYGNKEAVGGFAAEFYRAIYDHYADNAAWTRESRSEYIERIKAHWAPQDDRRLMWTFEPHVAERILNEMVRRAGVTVVFGERLDLHDGIGVEMQGPRIIAAVMESGRRFRGRTFIDASYEGDLMALAGISHHVGRESNATYGERFNGVQKRLAKHHQFEFSVDPYITPGDPASGLLPEIQLKKSGEDGQGDQLVQAYNFRLCLTDDPQNRVPISPPPGYEPRRYELLLRYLLAGFTDVLGLHEPMPNRKSDANNYGPFSLDYVGGNAGYVEGDYATRERIIRGHANYQRGLLYFLAHDPRVPEAIRRKVEPWGLARDEFPDTGYWPHQLYIREARRMIGEYMMIDRDVLGLRQPPEPVALGGFGMDSHNCQRYVDANGHARMEGNVYISGFSPYPISYRSIVPRKTECQNLIVPVCASASHIAYGSIRMEPVFMSLGQAAGTAAALAIDADLPVQEVQYDRLRQRLIADGQIVEWTGPAKELITADSLAGTVVDDLAGEAVGAWTMSGFGQFVDVGYHHDLNSDKGGKAFRFTTQLPKQGLYEVRLAYSTAPNRASNVPITIHHAGGTTVRRIDQRESPPIKGLFISLGEYRFATNQLATVEVSNAGTNGYVIADAVQWLPID